MPGYIGVMTLSRMLRPVLLGLTGLATTSCGMVESDPHRFESMAQAVADIPLAGEPRSVRTAAETGLRPAFAETDTVVNPRALRVEVMDPHDLWDARDAGLRGAVVAATPAIIEAAAPVVAQRVAAELPARIAPAVEDAVEHATIQLGAFASRDAAQRAWSRIASAGHGVAGLSPVFETAHVDGRELTRLKVVTPAHAARSVCRAADAADLGCLRRG